VQPFIGWLDYRTLAARLIGRISKGAKYGHGAMGYRVHDFIHAFGML
jgi:hypothetical protein